MGTSANQIVARAPRVVRVSVVLADGVRPINLSYVDSAGQLILASSFELQNLGPQVATVSFESTGAEYRTVIVNGVYGVEAQITTPVWVATAGTAVCEFTVTYDRFR